ncbi:DUF2913 family protein [Salmonella enterica]|nr:DUF2913 family protein [Salmonella enterica]EEI9343015.1 DUF2913 family protein [Salmonella enterica subsp. enterica serovar Hvittingfoss]EHI4845745.1 DUF2913 family protein [Salmonella enterica]HEC6701044.1 DUF2913 family protein [Salmonella enterica subsp. enterica serovar Weltevreden]HEC6915039.1 DUF2913 family protein [Salmonella enterica subsp. enterica serovar Weltevreden]
MSVNGKNEKTAHLVWCAMIALHLARLNGRVQSEQQENQFLVRWFADAERQPRFSRDMATDIRWMLQQGQSLGVRAQLARKLDYIWRSTTGNIMEQTELFRLTWGLETAKSQQWVYHVLSDTEWLRLRRQSLNPDVCAVYIPKSALKKAFSDEGKQTAPVPVRITGNAEAFDMLLTTCGWQIQSSPEPDILFLQAK